MSGDEASEFCSPWEEERGVYGIEEGVDAAQHNCNVQRTSTPEQTVRTAESEAVDISSLPSWTQRILLELRAIDTISNYLARLHVMLIEQRSLTLGRECAMACACRAAVIELHAKAAPVDEIAALAVLILSDWSDGRSIATVDGLLLPLELHLPAWDFERGRIDLQWSGYDVEPPRHLLRSWGQDAFYPVYSRREQEAFYMQHYFAELAHALHPAADVPSAALDLLASMERRNALDADGVRRFADPRFHSTKPELLSDLDLQDAHTFNKLVLDSDLPQLDPRVFMANPYRLYLVELSAAFSSPPPYFMWWPDLIEREARELCNVPVRLCEHAHMRWQNFDQMRGATAALLQLQQLLDRQPIERRTPAERPPCPNCNQPIPSDWWTTGLFSQLQFSRENGGRKRQCCSMHCERQMFHREMEKQCKEQHGADTSNFLGDRRFYYDCPTCLRQPLRPGPPGRPPRGLRWNQRTGRYESTEISSAVLCDRPPASKDYRGNPQGFLTEKKVWFVREMQRRGTCIEYSDAEYLKAYKRATRDPDKDNSKRKARASYGKRKADEAHEPGTGLRI